MTVAIPIWDGRISPVLDVAARFLLVDFTNSQEVGRRELLIANHLPSPIANGIKEAGIDVLICGAVSQPLEMLIKKAGVHVMPHICGEIDEVLKAFSNNQLDRPEFVMPGCWMHGQNQRCCSNRGLHPRQHRHRAHTRSHTIQP